MVGSSCSLPLGLDCIGRDVALYRITLDNEQTACIIETAWGGFTVYERDEDYDA